ncbi:hypothetical protein Sjap_012792 [Stephania japonica]|uniref:Uncharacterized protein n=1 Tax=Stephania japonica TaxID=461633 RepID=A0AAP0NZ98_9MAGN
MQLVHSERKRRVTVRVREEGEAVSESGREEAVRGAATTCFVALHPSLKGVTGKYFQDCNEFKPSKLARDQLLAKELWDFSSKSVHSA